MIELLWEYWDIISVLVVLVAACFIVAVPFAVYLGWRDSKNDSGY